MVTPEELIRLAQQLCADTSESEASSRAAASRAYYGAYHACAHIFQPEYDPEQKSGMHKQFISTLLKDANPRVRQVGIALREIYKTRVHADYTVEMYFNPDDAKDAADSAMLLLRQLPDFI